MFSNDNGVNRRIRNRVIAPTGSSKYDRNRCKYVKHIILYNRQGSLLIYDYDIIFKLKHKGKMLDLKFLKISLGGVFSHICRPCG